MRRSDGYKSSWVVSCRDSTKTVWGEVKVWGGMKSTCVKMISMLPGTRTSLKYNPQKSEALIVISGKVHAKFGDEHTLQDQVGHPWKECILEPGMTLNVQSQCPYRLTALEDSQIIEIGNHLADNPVRIEDDYGRE